MSDLSDMFCDSVGKLMRFLHKSTIDYVISDREKVSLSKLFKRVTHESYSYDGMPNGSLIYPCVFERDYIFGVGIGYAADHSYYSEPNIHPNLVFDTLNDYFKYLSENKILGIRKKILNVVLSEADLLSL